MTTRNDFVKKNGNRRFLVSKMKLVLLRLRFSKSYLICIIKTNYHIIKSFLMECLVHGNRNVIPCRLTNPSLVHRNIIPDEE